MDWKKNYRKRKMGLRTYLLNLSLMVVMVACDAGFDTLPSGLEYKFVAQHDSVKPENGEYLMLDLLVKTAADSVLFSTRQYGTLFPFRYDSYKMKVGLDNPLEEGFHLMSVGDSAQFRMPAEELYKSSFGVALPDSLDARQYVSVFARAVTIYDYDTYSQWRTEQTLARSTRLESSREEQLAEEKNRIKELLDREGREYRMTDSGIGYFLLEEGKGPAPAQGDTVHVMYEVRYSDGTRIAGELGSSGPEGKSLVVGGGHVLPCWEESIGVLSEGGRGRFYFPSACILSQARTLGLRPDAILVIDVQLLEIR